MAAKYDVILGALREADEASSGVISVNGMTGAVVIANASTTAAGLMSASDKSKLDGLNDGYKGYFATLAALQTAYPAGQSGWFVTGGWTDTIWSWDSDTSAWVNTDSNTINPTWNNIQNKPTTISGYGITDLTLSGRVITVGSSTVTIPDAADQISISDRGGYYTGTNVETALQEIGSTLNGLQSALEAI